MAHTHTKAVSIALVTLQMFIANLVQAKGAQETTVKLMNANIASDYVVTTSPMNIPDCPMLGFLRVLPGSVFTAILITDMARSKARLVTGKYEIIDGRNIKFASDDASVPMSNMSGPLAFSTADDPRRPPIDYLTLTTDTASCPQQIYKFALYEQEE